MDCPPFSTNATAWKCFCQKSILPFDFAGYPCGCHGQSGGGRPKCVRLTNKVVRLQAFEYLGLRHTQLPLERTGVLGGSAQVLLIELLCCEHPLVRRHVSRLPLVLCTQVHEKEEFRIVDDESDRVDAHMNFENKL